MTRFVHRWLPEGRVNWCRTDRYRGSLLECKNAFHAEILTPSACCTILSRLRSRLSHPPHVFSLGEGGGLKPAREGTRWTSERRKREDRTHGSQSGNPWLDPRCTRGTVGGVGKGGRPGLVHQGSQEVERAGHPPAR